MKKYYFLMLVVLGVVALSISAKAETCTVDVVTSESEANHVINTDVPKHLQDAVIIVRTKDGRESQVSANQFKVVPRKQQRLVTVVKYNTQRTCKVNTKDKNLLMVGGRRDHRDLDIRVNGKTATVESEKGLVLDAAYMRQNLFDSALGIGAGIDTNGTLRGIIGVEF